MVQLLVACDVGQELETIIVGVLMCLRVYDEGKYHKHNTSIYSLSCILADPIFELAALENGVLAGGVEFVQYT
jgi:hypothetical protein